MQVSFGSNMPPDFNEKDLVTIGLHTWQLDCSRITVKSRDKKERATYYGAGRLFLDASGSLSFECYSHRERNTKQWDFGPFPKAGKLIPDAFYYDLICVDYNGREWRGYRTIPRVHRTADGRAVIRGEIDEMSTSGQMPEEIKLTGASIMMWAFDDIDIPTNRSTLLRKTISGAKVKSTSGTHNAWQFTCHKIEYLLIKEDGPRLTVRIKSREPAFPDGFERRVAEAFLLVLGKPIKWMALRKQEGQNIEVRVRKRIKSRGRLNPPLPSGNISIPASSRLSAKYHRSLFYRFIGYTMGTESYRHPIWGQLNAISEASGSTFIDAKALTLSVAIESLLGSGFPNLGKPTKKAIMSIDQIQSYISEWHGDPSIKKRIMSMVGNLKSPRAMDRMRSLAKKGAITKEQYEAWSRLRNPSAHGYLASGMPGPELIELIQKCEVLFYHLLFECVGYKGPYIDYSTPGWPLRTYPGNALWN